MSTEKVSTIIFLIFLLNVNYVALISTNSLSFLKTKTSTTQATLTSGNSIGMGNGLISPNAKITAILSSTNGNFQMFCLGTISFYATGTVNTGYNLTLETTGNLKITNVYGATVWTSNTANLGTAPY